MTFIARMKYRLLVCSLMLVVCVAKACGFKGHILADAEGDAGYGKLGAHRTFGYTPAPLPVRSFAVLPEWDCRKDLCPTCPERASCGSEGIHNGN